MSATDGNLQHAEERLTVLLAQTGDRPAFRELVDRYDRRLLYFVRRILGETEDAFDVVQAVWIVVHRSLRRLAAPEAFRVWLYRIAHDQAVSELRRRSRQPVLLDDVEESRPGEQTEPVEEAFDNAELVHAGLRDLSVDHRRVLTLKFLEDMTVDEISEVLQCQPGTVKSRLHYARLALRDRIRELLDD